MVSLLVTNQGRLYRPRFCPGRPSSKSLPHIDRIIDAVSQEGFEAANVVSSDLTTSADTIFANNTHDTVPIRLFIYWSKFPPHPGKGLGSTNALTIMDLGFLAIEMLKEVCACQTLGIGVILMMAMLKLLQTTT